MKYQQCRWWCPGTVNVEEGAVVKAPNLPCLDGFRLAAALTEQLSLPAILENDANAAAVGEMWQGAAVGCNTIICVTLGTGVGGGIILDGKLWRGVDGAAAEIGHMCVDPFGGVACTCGSRGCLGSLRVGDGDCSHDTRGESALSGFCVAGQGGSHCGNDLRRRVRKVTNWRSRSSGAWVFTSESGWRISSTF